MCSILEYSFIVINIYSSGVIVIVISNYAYLSSENMTATTDQQSMLIVTQWLAGLGFNEEGSNRDGWHRAVKGRKQAWGWGVVLGAVSLPPHELEVCSGERFKLFQQHGPWWWSSGLLSPEGFLTHVYNRVVV